MTLKTMFTDLFSWKKTLTFTGLAFVLCFLFIACEDDPVLDINGDEDCVGSYCLLVKPSDTNRSIVMVVNPKVF